MRRDDTVLFAPFTLCFECDSSCVSGMHTVMCTMLLSIFFFPGTHAPVF